MIKIYNLRGDQGFSLDNHITYSTSLIEVINLIGGEDALVAWDRDYDTIITLKIIETLPPMAGLWNYNDNESPRGCLLWPNFENTVRSKEVRLIYEHYKWRIG